MPVLLALLIVAAAFAIHVRRNAQAPLASTPAVGSDAVMVLPLDVKGARDDGWVRLGGMDLIATRLRMAGLPVPPSENVLVLVQAAGKGSAAVREGLEQVEKGLKEGKLQGEEAVEDAKKRLEELTK